MNYILLGILIACVSFLTFLFLLLAGLRKKNKKIIFIAIAFLLATLASGLWSGFLFANRAYNKLKTVNIDNPFRPRTGNEIYSALFGKPKENCLTVINKRDQFVPRLDCCIWLEFKTCPIELSRIIALEEKYTKKELLATDTMAYIPTYSPRPEWFRPILLGDSIVVMRKYNPENPNRDQLLIFSKDSTYAFYCDMAD